MTQPMVLWTIIAIAVVIAAAVVWFFLRKQRTDRLRTRFGPEYDRTARDMGSVPRAEATLEARVDRVERFHIRPLTAADGARFTNLWREVQRRFVDDPNAATAEADRLVGEVMQTRGYPLGDFDQRVADISVDHPHVVTQYLAAREIARRRARGEASTEDLRQAMVHYRALFSELLEIQREPMAAEEPVPTDNELTRSRAVEK